MRRWLDGKMSKESEVPSVPKMEFEMEPLKPQGRVTVSLDYEDDGSERNIFRGPHR